MKEIKREVYLNKLIERKENNLIKFGTGIRQGGKSYLLDPLYKNYLLQNGADTFTSNDYKEVSINIINSYLNYLIDAFLIERVKRYDVKDKKYISTPSKYYFSDIGLRNARLNFRQQEENHIMENIVYNELLTRGYNVGVGVVETREKDTRKQLEVDFVCNQSYKRYYIQVALNLDTREKTLQEEKSLLNINDNFKKIIIVKDDIIKWYTEEGILVIGILEFLLNKDSLDL